jgi:hypothetical protein
MTNETTQELGVSQELDENALASAFENAPFEGEAAPADAAAESQEANTTENETPESADPDESNASSIEYLDQFAKESGVELSELLGLKVKLKVDGEEKDATLQDLIKINQLEGHVNRKSIELSEKQKAFESEQATLRNEWQQKIQMAGSVIDNQEQQLAQQYRSIDWNGLYQADPAQYSALQLRFQQAHGELQQQKQALTQHYQQNIAQMRNTLRPKAIETIRSQNPDLADDVSYGNALAEIKGYLKSIGADDKNFDAVEMDPVVFKVARDAARYQQIASKKPDISAKLKAAPTMQKPSPKETLGTQAARLKGLRERAFKGDSDAQAAFLESL